MGVRIFIENTELLTYQRRELEEIAVLFDKFNYPEKWKSFLYYQPHSNGKFLSVDGLYQNFIRHVDQEMLKKKYISNVLN